MELREYFGLTDYSEETIEKVLDYRLSIYKNREKCQYFSIQEIAEMENMKQEDVEKILSNAAIVWTH